MFGQTPPTDPAASEDMGGHPLFPRAETETGPDKRRFDRIHVERTLPDGTREICPRTFKGSELVSLQQVIDLYGGGSYTFRAQCAKTHQWQGQSPRYDFPSIPSKPFHETRPTPQTAAAAPLAPYPPPPWPGQPPALTAPASPYGPAYPPHPPHGWNPYYPPAPTGAQSDSNALVLSMMKGVFEQMGVLMRVMMERTSAAAPASANGLELFREMRPLLTERSGTNMLVQGIELAGKLYQQTQSAAAAAPAPQTDDFASIATMIQAMMGSPIGTPALPFGTPFSPPAAPAAPFPPPAPYTAPPAAAPPTPPAAPPAAAPPSTSAASASNVNAADVQKVIQSAAQNPAMLAMMYTELSKELAARNGQSAAGSVTPSTPTISTEQGTISAIDYGEVLRQYGIHLPPDEQAKMAQMLAAMQTGTAGSA